MKKELLNSLLTDLAVGLVEFIVAENVADLDGHEPDTVIRDLVAGQKAPDGCYFQVDTRRSGSLEIWFLGDGGPFSDPAGVAATVDRGGRVWVRGGDRSMACIETSADW